MFRVAAWLAYASTAAALAGCPSAPKDETAPPDTVPADAPNPSGAPSASGAASAPSGAASAPSGAQPSSAPPGAHPSSAPSGAHQSATDFEIPDITPLPPLTGPAAKANSQWLAPNTDARCRFRMREVLDETTGGQLSAAHQLVVTYDVFARPHDDHATAYTATVRHVRARGRRLEYNTKLDSGRPGDMVRVEGGADTTILFDVVVPFALLDRPLEVIVAPDGRLLSVKGGDAVRKRMLALHPPLPRKSPHYQGRVDVLLSDARLAAYLLPMAGLVPTGGPAEGQRDDADYTAKVLTNTRRRAVGPAVMWEQKQALGEATTSSVPPLAGGTKVALESGQRSTTVEQVPGQACFRQAGASETRKLEWTGVVDKEEVTLPQQRTLTRLWVQAS